MYYSVETFFRNIHHLSDGRFAAGIWAKYASFNFDKESKAYISPVHASEIIGWMSGPEIVAEFGKNSTIETIDETTKLLKIESIAIPSELLNETLQSKFKKIFITDSEHSVFPFFTKSLSSNPLGVYQTKLSKEEAEKILQSEAQMICLEGIPEDKPGMADYEALSIFMEYLEE